MRDATLLALLLPSLLLPSCMSTSACRELVAQAAASEEGREDAERRLDELERRQVGWLEIGFGVAGIDAPAATALWIARNQTRKKWAQHS